MWKWIRSNRPDLVSVVIRIATGQKILIDRALQGRCEGIDRPEAGPAYREQSGRRWHDGLPFKFYVPSRQPDARFARQPLILELPCPSANRESKGCLRLSPHLVADCTEPNWSVKKEPRRDNGHHGPILMPGWYSTLLCSSDDLIPAM